MSDETLKEQLIQATMSLIREDQPNITIRKIAERAGVGVGLVNYHFQTKKNLINIAAQRVIDGVISQVPAVLESFEGTPLEKLKLLIKSTMGYIEAHPNVSRISILRDMNAGCSADNTEMTILAYNEVLKEIIPEKDKQFLAGHIICASLQSLFLRADVLREMNGFDFHNKAQRDRFVDDLLDIVLKGLN